jgi:Rrf2 family protein
MQLTRAADYAVRVMLHLASQPEGAVVSRNALARASDVPESFLSKILQAMARAGLIQARRGVVGGFVLLPRGAQASVLDVVESIDGPMAINVCLGHADFCRHVEDCSARRVWEEAQAAMVGVLRRAKIAEMAARGASCGLHAIAPAAPKVKAPKSKPKRKESDALTRSRKSASKAVSAKAPSRKGGASAKSGRKARNG